MIRRPPRSTRTDTLLPYTTLLRSIARLVACYSVTSDFVDHFRAEGQTSDYGWEARWVREEGHLKIGAEAIDGLLRSAKVAASEIRHFAVGISARGAGAALAKKAGIASDALCPDLAGNLGSAGAAHALILLASVLERATEIGRAHV